MVKTNGWLVRTAVLFIFLLNIEVSLINSALGEIAKAFPTADPVLINLVSTSSVVFMFLCSFIVGRVGARYDKRKIVLIALVIYIIGGLGGYLFSYSIWALILSRSLVGIGAGMTAPLVGCIVSELWHGPDRARMLGWANGFDSLLAVFITMLAGVLGAINWRYTFFAYGVFILVLLLEAYALPSIPPPVARQAVEKPQFTPKQKAKLALIAGFVFLNLMAGMLLFLKMPIMVTQDGLGGPAQIAMGFSANTAGACISALCFGWIYRVFKRYTLAVYLALTAVAFLIVLSAHSIPIIVLGFFINGLGNGLMIPSIEMKAIGTGPRANVSYAMSVAFGALFLGQIAAGFVEKLLGVFGDPAPRTLMTFSLVMFLLYLTAYLIWTRVVPEENNEISPEMRGDVAPEVSEPALG
ncbi:MFS transporter [Cellulomonas sp. KRMCY2]|uniref:MFS transporter n=1 Tax=Cellulomonas sp. KRMCY2 TaxID=1304865 RepID=UPI00045EB88A|nr:MFS transporter [Cellulomonas sp. KRMCY2]